MTKALNSPQPLTFSQMSHAVVSTDPSHTIQQATIEQISVSLHITFNLVLIALYRNLLFEFFKSGFLGWRFNSDLRSLIARRLCRHTRHVEG